jgi:hypothetical protein
LWQLVLYLRVQSADSTEVEHDYFNVTNLSTNSE